MRNALRVITASHLSAFCLQSIEHGGAAIGLDGQRGVGGWYCFCQCWQTPTSACE